MRKKLTSSIVFLMFLSVSSATLSTSITYSLGDEYAWAQSKTTSQDQQSQADSLFKKAQQHLEISQNFEAYKTYQEALIIYQKLGDSQSQAKSLNGMGTAYYNDEDLFNAETDRVYKFDIFDAKEPFLKALAISKKIGNQKLEAESLLGLGRAAYRLSFYEEAIKYYDQSLVIFKKIGDRQAEGRNLRYLGIAHSSRSDIKKGLSLYQQAINIAKQVGDYRGESAALQEICYFYRYALIYEDKPTLSKKERYQKSLEYCQQSLDILLQLQDYPKAIQVLRVLASGDEAVIDLNKSVLYYQKTLEIANQLGDQKVLKKTFTSLGYTYDDLKQYQKAIDAYLQALKIEKQGISTPDNTININLYSLYKYLGRAYNNLEQYSSASNYYLQSLEIAKRYSKRYGDGRFTEKEVLLGLGDAYYGQKKYQQAIGIYQDSLTIYKGASDRETQGSILWNMGSAYFELAKYQQAIANFQESLSIYEKLNLAVEKSLLLLYLGDSFFASEQYQNSIDTYQKALALKKELGDSLGVDKILENIQSAQQAIKKTK